jgi:aminoglycoside phosphotransferase (APT) family kinase protein/dienelactone hydrolase
VNIDRWRQIESLFSEAMAQPAALRAPFIERRCDDTGMRDELVSLIDAAEASDGFLSAPALDVFARQVSREGWTVRVGERVAAYTVTERIGAGGMGEVWRARDERLGRDVALKLLLPHAADVTARSRAFEREARAAGALNHPNVLTVYDIGDHRGAPFIVMECLEGRTLRARLAEGRLPIDDALRVALQVARGLHAAHARGIVHRDLKPENIFLTTDGGVKILDFGIAALAADEGIAAGTPGYVAPEQLRGGTIDARADIFAFGAVLREMTAETPPALADLIARCVELSPEHRIGTVQEVIAALESIVRLRQPPQSRALALLRRPAIVAGLIVAVVATGVVAWNWYRTTARVRWAHMTAAPEIRRLAGAGDYPAAFMLAHEARRAAPGDPQLDQLWLDVSMTANLISDPDGADVLLSTYRTPPHRWLELGRTPLRDVRVPRGLARLRLTKAGYEPFDGTIHPLPEIRVRLDTSGGTPPGMVRVSGGRDPLRFGAIPAVDDFWIDRFEVTNRAFKAFVDAGGYRDRSHWREPLIDDGRELSWDAAMARFRDRTGRPGPATWTNGTYSDGQADFPAGGVSWYEAAAYARFAGKSLPTMYHWYRAAALGRFFDILPLSNFTGAGPARAGEYAGLGAFGTYDMAGNVKEWCWNASGARRFALGGAWNEPRYVYADYDARPPFDRAAHLGFRLAKYERPLSAAATDAIDPFEADRVAPPRPPVSEEIFDVYRRQYAYDAAPLNAAIEATEETDLWTRTVVTFDAAYGGERIRAHLFLPRSARPPYQTVVFFGGADAFRLRSSRDMALGPAEMILRSGRAVLYPVYKGTYERQAPEVIGVQGRRERRIAVYRDLARSIDYLETRPDIDRNRLAFYGISTGGHAGVFLTALESRFKTSVLQGAGLDGARAPEIDLRNFAPRVRVPTLLLAGRYDFEVPYDTAQRPLFELLGPPASHKRLASVESGHSIPTDDLLDEVLPWLDRYLGPVTR